jgi:hypothetical protein
MVTAIPTVLGPPVDQRIGEFFGKRLAPDLVEKFITGK